MKRLLALAAIFLSLLICLCASGSAQELVIPDQAMLNRHGAIMLLIDAGTGDIAYANNAAVAFYGYSLEELLSMKISQINTLTSEQTAQRMQDAKMQTSNFFVFRHRTKSGEIKTVEVSSYPVEKDGKTLLFSIIHDVTAATLLAEQHTRLVSFAFTAGSITILALLALSIVLYLNRRRMKETKEAKEHLERLYKTYIDANDSLIYLKDENLKYVIVNHATVDFYHRGEEQIIGHTDFELSEEAFAQKRKDTDIMALEKHAVIDEDVEWCGRIYRNLKFPVPLPNGQTGVGAYITDITDIRISDKRREKALLRNQALAGVLNGSFSSKKDMFNYILQHILKLTDSQYGYIQQYDEKTEQLTWSFFSDSAVDSCGLKEEEDFCDLSKTGLWGEAIRQRKPIILNDYDAPHPSKHGYPQGHIPIKRFMSLPVLIDQRIVAVVGLANKETDYDDDDVQHMVILMVGIWNAVIRRDAQEKLSLERERYQQTLLSIGDGVMVVDKEGRVEMLNPVAEGLIGWSLKEAFGMPYQNVFTLTHERQGMVINDPIEDAMRTQTVQEMENHAVLISRDGSHYNLEDSAAPIRDDAGNIIGVVLVFRNVTEKKEQQREIEYLSFHDSLTGLYNRRFFEEELRRLDTQRNLPVSIIIGDVNNLKLTNDVFGHNYGDMLLKRLAQVLHKVCRADDIIARWGGDEFSLLLPKTPLAVAQQITQRIRAEFARERIKAVKGSVSMGAAAKEADENDMLDVVNKAEEEMYLAKVMEHSEVMKGAFQTILQMLHDNSPREKEHADRVSSLCQEMGKRLNLSADEAKRLRDAGYLHDIGKVVLDSRLLENQYHLSTQEWNEIKRHPVVGYRILNAFDDMLDLAPIVLAHQERWDGTGYPKGLKEEEIPRDARIIALAESYERKRSGAENTQPMNREEALEAISEKKGTHFDPALTEIFVAMMKECGQALDQG